MRLDREQDPLPRQLAFAFAALAALAWIALRSWPDALLRLARCPLRDMTGIPCSTCAGTHAAVALARLDIAAACAANPLVPLAALVLVGWLGWALLATLDPRWRMRLVASVRERRVLRAAAIAGLIGFWAWQVCRLR